MEQTSETIQLPDPVRLRHQRIRWQAAHILAGMLPPPLDPTPEALRARDDAAIEAVADLAPANHDEAEIAAHCIAARGRAAEALRLVPLHHDDIRTVLRLNAQFNAMHRTAIRLRDQLSRLQAERRKRDADPGAADSDAWLRHIAGAELREAMAQPAPPAEPVGRRFAAPGEPAEAEARSAAPVPPQAAAPVPPQAAASAPLASATRGTTAPVSPAQPPEAIAASPPARPPAQQAGRAAAAPAAAPVPGVARPTPPRDDIPHNLATEAALYEALFPDRAHLIRQHGGVPPHCTFGPPDDAVVRAIVAASRPGRRGATGHAAAA